MSIYILYAIHAIQKVEKKIREVEKKVQDITAKPQEKECISFLFLPIIFQLLG